ncbi:hypothetical protein V2J09_023919 [Rumex salicifolius]
MAIYKLRLTLPLFAVALFFQSEMAVATTFTLLNKCDYTIWPGILSNAGVAQLSSTGFALQTGETQTISLPAAWAGRLWGRTHCTADSTTGNFVCQTGDCGSGKIECAGGGAAPPTTLAEFTLDGYGGQDFYDVSLVDGYNLAMTVVPVGGTGNNCSSTGCVSDLNGSCPTELSVMSDDGGQSVACKSACEAFTQPQYCCTGAYATPDTCTPSTYSQVFKAACPRAYSYAYDDKTSTFICGNSPDYAITFCPSPTTSQKKTASTTDGNGTATASSLVNGSMVYEGAMETSGSDSMRTWSHVIQGGVVTALWAWMCRHHY